MLVITMGLFKKDLRNEKIYEELSILLVKFARLEGELEETKQQLRSLRSLVNKKLGYVDVTKDNDNTKDLNTQFGIGL